MITPRVKVKRPRPKLLFDELDLLFKTLKNTTVAVESQVVSVGGPAAYSLVWEFGNARQTKKGPKTTLGINPNGERVWLTIQAPRGYIRVLVPQFKKIITEEIEAIRFAKKFDAVEKALIRAAGRIAKRMRKLLRETVPVDKHDLQKSLQVFVNAQQVEVGD